MATIIKIGDGSEPVIIEVLVVGLSQWQLSFQSSENHQRNTENTSDIELGAGNQLIDTLDNWQFNVSAPGENMTLKLKWFQGGEEKGSWSEETGYGQHIYVGQCLYEKES